MLIEIFFAPLRVILLTLFAKETDETLPLSYLSNDPPAPLRHLPGLFLIIGSFLSVMIIIFGFYLALGGQEGTIKLTGMGIELETNVIGVGIIALGAIVYLTVGKLVLDAERPN